MKMPAEEPTGIHDRSVEKLSIVSEDCAWSRRKESKEPFVKFVVARPEGKGEDKTIN